MTDRATVDDSPTTDPGALLNAQLMPGRFTTVTDPLGWRCLGCTATVTADPAAPADRDAINRLAESAADHALFCGRCDD